MILVVTPTLFVGDPEDAAGARLPMIPVLTPAEAHEVVTARQDPPTAALLPWEKWEDSVATTLRLLGSNDRWIERCLMMGRAQLDGLDVTAGLRAP
jgi:hypothetical protein